MPRQEAEQIQDINEKPAASSSRGTESGTAGTDLQRVIEAWPVLPDSLKRWIVQSIRDNTHV